MSLQLHRPDGKGGYEVRSGGDTSWRESLRSTRWGASLKGGKLPELRNTEMNPTSSARAVAFWVVLAVVTFALVMGGYGLGVWHLPIAGA